MVRIVAKKLAQWAYKDRVKGRDFSSLFIYLFFAGQPRDFGSVLFSVECAPHFIGKGGEGVVR